MTLRSKCLIYLVITAALWSMSGVLIKSIAWNPLAISSARSLVAGFTIIFLMRKKLRQGSFFKGLGSLQWLAGFFLALVSLTFVSATKLTTAANAILLQYTAPVWAALLAPLLLRERTSNRDWFFMLAAFGGMTLFFGDALSLEGFWGNILGMASGLCFAALAMTTRCIKDAQPAKAMILGNLLTFLMGFYFWFEPGEVTVHLSGIPLMAGFTELPQTLAVPAFPDLKDIILILIAGVFQFGLSYYLYTLAAAGVSSLEMVVVAIIEPVLSPIWVYLVIGEAPGPWAMAGGGIVLSVVAVWSVLKATRPA